MSEPKVRVLIEMLDSPGAQYGYELMRAAGVASGVLYPILAQLERDGWVESDWEDADPHTEGRPRRHWYVLTERGRSAALSAITRYMARRRPPSY